MSDLKSKFKKNTVEVKESNKPFISINKLAEYMTATALRRRQIIKNMKKDSDFFKIYYSELKNVLRNFFKSDYNFDMLEELIEKIESKKPETDWDKTDNANTILAIENVLESNLPDLTDYEFIKDSFKIKTVEISGVTVSIKPDFYVRNKGTKKIGAIKSHLSKTPVNQLENENRIFAATLIKYSFIDFGFRENEIDDNACISYDIFKNDYTSSPKSFKRTMRSIEAACEEISLRWDSI